MSNLIETPAHAAVGRNQAFELERHQLAMPQVEIPVTHYLKPNSLEREVRIPAGVSLTGAIQLFDCINYLTQGEITVLTRNGMERVKAPWCEITPAGTKRVGYTHTDCIWTSVYITSETDPEKVRTAFTTNDESVYLAHVEALKLEGSTPCL